MTALECHQCAGLGMLSTMQAVWSVFFLGAGSALHRLRIGCRCLIGDLIEFVQEGLNVEFSRGAGTLHCCGIVVARDLVGGISCGVGSSASASAKRYDSGKMRNMCKSTTLQIKEDAQHAQIVEMRKPYETRKMRNMCKMCIVFAVVNRWFECFVNVKKSGGMGGSYRPWS